MAGGGRCERQTVRQEEEDNAESALLVLQCSDQTMLTTDRGRDGVPIENCRELLIKLQSAVSEAACQLGILRYFQQDSPASQQSVSCFLTITNQKVESLQDQSS